MRDRFSDQKERKEPPLPKRKEEDPLRKKSGISDGSSKGTVRSSGSGEILPKESSPFAERFSSWLLSISFHIVLMIVLALLIFPSSEQKIAVQGNFAEDLGDQLETYTLDEGNLNPNQAEEYKIEVPPELKVADVLLLDKPINPVDSQIANRLLDQSRIDIKDTLSGRMDPGTKNDLIAKYGGNRLTRDSVKFGLAWIAKQQDREGKWSMKGPYKDGLSVYMTENNIAATALALLAFQGDGNTRTSGEYASRVRRGWSWLLRQQNSDGLFFKEVNATTSDRFYTHALSTIAVCELIVLERYENKTDPALKEIAVKAIRYLEKHQQKELGGWRYEPDIDSDLSVTGWCLMALQTAKMADLPVPSEMLEKISGFLDKVAIEDGSGYVYMLPKNTQQKRPSMVATGLLCRLYLGWDRNNPAVLKGAEYLTQSENLVKFPKLIKEEGQEEYQRPKNEQLINVYGWYSASMMLKHLGPYHKYWIAWNKALCSEIPTHQIPEGKAEAGSWDPVHDEYYFGGGRLYVTSLSILCMEVYYRHLAIFH